MLAFLIWAWAVKGIGAVKANNYLYVQPIITLVASAVFLGEQVTWIGYLGCGLILFGVGACRSSQSGTSKQAGTLRTRRRGGF